MNERAIALLHEAIALLSGDFPATQTGVDAAAAQYLQDNPDVANHVYFGRHPLEHWQIHGKNEGRKWPGTGQTFSTGRVPEQAMPTVTSPGGHTFPAPDVRENGMGYIQRVGTFLGREDEWARRGGELMLGTDHLVPRNVKYPDDYAAWKSDTKNWPRMAEAFWFPVAQAPDPGWQQVHDRMRDGNVPPQGKPEPPDETPL